MSDTCPHAGCVWEMPAKTPDNLTAYVVDLHRAYWCPQPVPHAQQAATRTDAEH